MLEGAVQAVVGAGVLVKSVSEPATLPTALAELEPDERAVLDLIYRLGLTQAQVAKRLALSEAAVRTKASRALRRIGRRMTGLAPPRR